MKQILQSVIATGALALVLATPAAPLQAAPGSLGRAGPAGATEDLTGLKATVVRDRWRPRHDRWRPRHDRWRPRHDRWRGRHGQPQRWRHRHRPYPHRATPYWSFTYPFPCIVAKPWPRGHWRYHRHRHYRGHRHPVPRHRHVRCYGGFTVVLPLPHPRSHAR